MSQISPPIRIVLVAAVAFLAAWMLVLRPKTEETPPPAPAATAPAKQPGTTAQSAAGKAVQAAANAKATAESAAKARAGETAAQTAPATTAAPQAARREVAAAKLGVDASALGSLPAGVRKALEARKIVVLGFFNRSALDDRLTKKQLQKVHRFHGRVYVHAAALRKVQRYQVITRGVDVSQTPSVVIIDRNFKAQLLTGYVDHVRVEQAIVDAMRRSNMPVVKSPVPAQGQRAVRHLRRQPAADVRARGAATTRARRARRLAPARPVRGAPDRAEGPEGLSRVQAKFVGDIKTFAAAFGALLAAVTRSRPRAKIIAVADKYDKPLAAADKRFDKLSRQHDMLACMYG